MWTAEATDGAMLGGARLVEGALVLRGVVLGEAHACARRWEPRRVPADLRLTAHVLAAWVAASGRVNARGYVVRLTVPWRDTAVVALQLRDLWTWEPVVERRAVRLVRSGDRMALVRLVIGLVDSTTQARLRSVRLSRPCDAAEAARRRAPKRLSDADVLEVRRRADLGHAYATIALDLGVSEPHIGRIARGEQRVAAGGAALRRRARVRRLNRQEVRTIRARVAAGESQGAVARDFGVGQSRVSRLVRSV